MGTNLTEEHQEEDEDEDDPEGDGKSSVESAYSEYLEKLKLEKPADESAAEETPKTWFWGKIKSVLKRRKTIESPDV